MKLEILERQSDSMTALVSTLKLIWGDGNNIVRDPQFVQRMMPMDDGWCRWMMDGADGWCLVGPMEMMA
jgi:hypothetical protein